MKKPKTAEHYYFATARMIEQAEYNKTKVWRPAPRSLDKDHPIYTLIMDCIQEAMEKGTDPIRIPRTACQIYMAI